MNDTACAVDAAELILSAISSATDMSVNFFQLEEVSPVLQFLSLEPSAADVVSFFIFSTLKTAETQQ